MKYVLYLLCVAMFGLCVVVILYPNDEITKVELARSGAWSDRGGAISVDKSLRCNFYYTYLGPANKPMSGYYTGTVSKQFWDTLNRKLQAINFKKISATDNMGASDVNYFELIVSWKTGKRRIVRMDNYDSSDSILKVIHWLNKSYKRINFTEEVKHPLKFETTFQNPPALKALGIDIDTMKFLPPLKRKKSNTVITK